MELSYPKEEVSIELMTQIKAAIEHIAKEEKPYQTVVCFKAEYNGEICYFEDLWWYPQRAIIKTGRGYERYDFSDELTFDQEMWEKTQLIHTPALL